MMTTLVETTSEHPQQNYSALLERDTLVSLLIRNKFVRNQNSEKPVRTIVHRFPDSRHMER